MACPKTCKCNKKRKFEPKKTPRLCPYLYDRTDWENDLKEYNMHRKRIFYMKPEVDTSPYPLNLRRHLDPIKHKRDMDRLVRIDKENKVLLQQLIKINRLGGVVDHVNEFVYSSRVTRWKGVKAKMLAIDMENRTLCRLLCLAESKYAKRMHDEEWKRTLNSMKRCCKFPLTIIKKEKFDFLKTGPSISNVLTQLGPRYQCYMEFKVQDGENLGQLILELYHDHLPVTVDNFFHICRGDLGLSYVNCPVHRIVKNKYFESGDIVKGTGCGGTSIYGKSFDEERHILQHSRAGVLTMLRVGNQQNDSRFCITFRDMHEWDKKNVVFGKVISGHSVLEKINGYGRTIGKPLRPVLISNCGLLPPCNCAENDYECQ